jgi:hypothetical protein
LSLSYRGQDLCFSDASAFSYSCDFLVNRHDLDGAALWSELLWKPSRRNQAKTLYTINKRDLKKMDTPEAVRTRM